MYIEKEFIPYEQALALKELGFDEPCFKYIYIGDTGINVDHYLEVETSKAMNFNADSLSISQPTFSQAFRFFREKYGLPSWIYTSNNKEYWYSILKDGRMLVRDYKPFETYEEAELAAIVKLIELVKSKQSLTCTPETTM